MLREIQPTLGPGAQGPDVANLQEALIALGDSGYFRSSDPPIPYEPPPPPGGPTLQPTAEQLSQFLKVVADRRRFQTYESATETVVAWFQAQAGLTDTPGVVEAATAKRLNIELRERRLFPEGYQHSIVGQVRRLSGVDPMVDILVRAFLLTPANVPIPLGDTYTDAAGAYAIPLDAATLVAAVPPGAAMHFLVQVFDDNGKLIAKTQHKAPLDAALIRMDVEVAGGDGALDTPQPGAPDPDLPRPDPGTPSWPRLPECDAGDYLVEGRVVDEQGRGLACLAVCLFEEDLSASTLLAGPVNTTAEGHYRFSFSPGVYRDGDVGLLPRSSPQPQPPEWWRAAVVQPAAPLPVLSGPDLWVGLGTDAASITTRTGIVFNAGLRTHMPDLVLTKASLHAGLSDLERVMGLVGPRLKGLSPAALNEQQISFLASDCEEPIALIQALVAAGRSLEQAETLAAQLGLPWPGGQTSQILAGLQFTAAVEHTLAALEQLVLLSDSDIISTLQYGMVRNRIPSHPDPAIESFAAWFAAFREKRNEAEQAPTRDDRYVQSPDDLFAIGWPEDPDSLQQLKERVTDIGRWMDDPNLRKAGSRQRFIDDLALPSDLAAPLHSLLRLNVLVNGQRALLQSLWPEISNYQAPEPLIALAGWEELDWINAAHTAGDERSLGVDPSSFGRQMALKAEALMPSPTLRRHLADNVIFQERPLYHDLAGRLSEHPDLDLMDESPEALAERLDLTEQQVAVLAGLRQFKLADWSWEETARAVAVNITSVDDVIRVGKDGVTQRLNRDGRDAAIDPLAIERLHGAATHFAGQAAGVLAVVVPSSIPLFAVATPFTPGLGTGTPAAEEDDDPTIRRILQLDACACDPCLSMLSPAAYRTDLLRFLEASVYDDEWFERRLGSARDLLLSCDNSRIEKCQLDLAIERMENRLVFPFPVVLAAGQQPAQQVQAPNLGSELRTALRSTTDLNDAQFGPFSVVQETSPSSSAAMGTTWLITDPARHWRVRALDERLCGTDLSNRVAATVNVAGSLGRDDAWRHGGSLQGRQ